MKGIVSLKCPLFRIWGDVVFYSSNYQQLVKLTLYFLPIEQKSPKAAIADLAKDFLNQSPNPEVRLF